MKLIRDVEGDVAATYAPQVEEAMPWTSANMVTAPGGVEWAAVAIAGVYENLWGRLLGDQPATEVSITYPAPGQEGIPATGWEASFGPGSHEGRGPATNRIAAVLTYARPYVPLAPGPGSVPQQLPAGSMVLTVAETGAVVPLQPGYPRSVPYGADAGEHMIALQPAADLSPCTTYRVAVTGALVDANLEPVVPTSWTFTTDGCPDPPPTTTTTTTTAASTTTTVPGTGTTATTLGVRPAGVVTPQGPPATPVRAAPTFAG
jgi:hypothetical protein